MIIQMRIKSFFASPMIIFFSCVAGLLGFGCAQQEVPCTVTHGDGWTEFNVPEHEGTNCEYSWSDSTEHVIANELQQNGEVLHKNDTCLRMKGCSALIAYLRDCTSEGTPRNSTCTTLCSDPQSPELQKGENSRHHLMMLVPISCALLLLLMIGVIVRCQKRCTGDSEIPQPEEEDA